MKIFLVTLFMLTTVSFTSQAGSVDALFGYSSADEFDIDPGADAEAEDAFTLGVRYKDELNKGLGWNVGLGLDTIRDFKGNDDELGFFLLEGNATLTVDQIKIMYIFAGLNYPLIVYEDSGVGDVDPVFGVQFGTGIILTPEFGFELAFRTVNFEFNNNDAGLWGFLFRGYYTFAAL